VRLAGHDRGVVVVEVLVRDQEKLGIDPTDRRVLEAQAAAGERLAVAERVDHEPPLAL
jgi:hypothetical protein